MDITERKITKIAREAEKLVLLSLREEGVGTAEIDLIHALRHHPAAPRHSWPSFCTRTRPPLRGGRKILKRRGISSAGTLPTTGAASFCIPRKRRRA